MDIKPRRRWGRNPAGQFHSTKKGKRGYERKRARCELRKLKREIPRKASGKRF